MTDTDPPLDDPVQRIVDLVIAKLEESVAGGPPDITLAHMRALRRENKAMAESQATMMKVLGRMERDIREIRGDIYSIENSALNRHNDLLEVMRKVEHIDDA